ncbi:unnamed protein product [Caenorhabditis sp. 36 PRJEB53466]|nr:unnamed protein product [Caenorhabditis sp. 36 PRJEB53466]
MPKIAVLGAGINGIATALAIQHNIPHAEVTVIADKFSPETTSDVAAGFIEPYLSDDSDDRIIKWTSATISRIKEYVAAGNSGAEEMSGYWLQSEKKVPKWLEIMKNVHVLSESEMEKVRKRPEHRFGIFFTTWYLEPTGYIRWTTEQFLSSGGTIRRSRVDNIDDVAAEGYGVIVNCTGLGSRQLFDDEEIHPVRGQIMRVQCGAVKHFLYDGQYYALLNDSCIILGGTAQPNDWNLSIDGPTASRIFRENCVNIPSLRTARILSHHVGLRPFRREVRLEVERRNGAPIVHNYGHGGSGITFHWGCALETVQLVRTVLEEDEKKAKL